MEKIIYLCRKLKAFTFDEIFVLAETPKEKLQKILEQLKTENIIKENAQGYVFIKEQANDTLKMVNANPVMLVETGDCNIFKNFKSNTVKNLTMEELEKIPEYNLKKFNKYMNLLKLTNGLYGQKLKAFIAEYNAKNPYEQTSYSSILRRRRGYILKGNSSLISKYGKIKRGWYDDKFYQLFKILYFSKERPSYQQCREAIAEHFNISIEKSPSVMHYRRKLKKEMSPDEVREKRYTICF